MIAKSGMHSDIVLLHCLESKDINDYKFIYDYFKICNKIKYCFKESTFNELIYKCKNNPLLSKYKSIIQENYNKLRIYLK